MLCLTSASRLRCVWRTLFSRQIFGTHIPSSTTCDSSHNSVPRPAADHLACRWLLSGAIKIDQSVASRCSSADSAAASITIANAFAHSLWASRLTADDVFSLSDESGMSPMTAADAAPCIASQSDRTHSARATRFSLTLTQRHLSEWINSAASLYDYGTASNWNAVRRADSIVGCWSALTAAPSRRPKSLHSITGFVDSNRCSALHTAQGLHRRLPSRQPHSSSAPALPLPHHRLASSSESKVGALILLTKDKHDTNPTSIRVK